MADAKRSLPVVTILFAVANVAVFAWELAAGADPMQPTAQWMSDHGGNFGPLTMHGEQWRLLTSMFLHYGLMHIAMNMIGLIDGGRHVEKMYGAAGFVAIYLVSGLAGGAASGLRGNVVSAGASGAIFGVFGAFGAFLVLHRARLDVEQVKRQSRGLVIFLVYNLYFGLTAKGIDLVAHGAGLAAGFVVGIALELGTAEDRSTLRRSLLVGVLGSAVVVALTFVVPVPSNALDEFSAVEHVVIERWNGMVPDMKSGKLTDVEAADAIDKDILPAWRAAHAKYEHDADDKLRAEMLEYIADREQGWDLISKALRTHDADGVKTGMARFSEGDEVIDRIKNRP